MIPGPRAPTTRPSRKTTARWYSRRTLSPLSTNAAKMAIAAHAPSIAASLQRPSRRARRPQQEPADAAKVLDVARRRSLPPEFVRLRSSSGLVIRRLLRLGRFLRWRGHGLRRRRCAFVLHLAFALFHSVDHEVTDKRRR